MILGEPIAAMKLLPCLFALWLPMTVLAGSLPPVQTVFIILMENQNWSDIAGNPSAPYINDTLLPMASHCEQYYNPPYIHPSLPNYLWLEAGTNFGVLDDSHPDTNHQNTTNHLAALLRSAGISWKTYQEDISGTYVPLANTNNYAVRHNPFVYFDDITGTNNPEFAYGIAHIRPYEELAGDLMNNTVARYNFITPNTCDDMHDCGIQQGDSWLAAEVPKILASSAYKNAGALFITWDEATGGDGPIGMIVLSPLARGAGYSNNINYTHSSTLRTIQEIFGVTPLLSDAADATDLSDLFSQYSQFRISSIVRLNDGTVRLTATGVIPGRTNLVQASSDLVNWTPVSTNISATNTFTVTDAATANSPARFYRLVQLP